MKKVKIVVAVILVIISLIIAKNIVETNKVETSETTFGIESVPTVKAEEIIDTPKLTTTYTSLGVPNINSSFKTWMSYRAVTNKRSPQYKFINKWGWADSEGFMRCSGERDLGIDQDYYLIALGSYYGTTIGTKYRITLDTGKVFYGALADCKNNKHTNSTNQYVPKNGNVVEFLVDTRKLNKTVKRTGSANNYPPLNGQVVKIERIDFV